MTKKEKKEFIRRLFVKAVNRISQQDRIRFGEELCNLEEIECEKTPGRWLKYRWSDRDVKLWMVEVFDSLK